MVEVVEVEAHVSTRLERPRGLVSVVERATEATEQPRHREVGLAVAEIDGGIEDDRLPGLVRRPVAAPEVAVQQRRQRAMAAQQHIELLAEPATALDQPTRMTLLDREVQLETESPLGEEACPVVGPRIRLRRCANRVVAMPAEPGRGHGMLRGQQLAESRLGARRRRPELDPLEREERLRARDSGRQHARNPQRGGTRQFTQPCGLRFEQRQALPIGNLDEHRA